MSQETPIHKLGGGQGSMNDEDSRLVDSILQNFYSKKIGIYFHEKTFFGYKHF